MMSRNTLRNAILAMLGLSAMSSSAHALTAYTNNYVTINVSNYSSAEPNSTLTAWVDDSNFLAQANYITAAGNGTFKSASLNSNADYFDWGLVAFVDGQADTGFYLDQSAYDVGWHYPDPDASNNAETNWIASVGDFPDNVSGYNMIIGFDYDSRIMTASLETIHVDAPAPVPLPASLPMIACGLLVLASVRFASRGVRR